MPIIFLSKTTCQTASGRKLIWLVLLFVLGLEWTEPSKRFALGSDLDLKTAIDEYQVAQTLQDPQQRIAAFSRAELAFAGLLKSESTPTAEMYVNWGNAALQAEKLGSAVVAYRLAIELDPNHKQAVKNLEFIRARLPEWARPIEATSPVIGQLLFWQATYSALQIYAFTSFMFLVGCVLIAISIRFRIVILRNIAVLPILVWAILLICEFSRAPSQNESAAVFVVDETTARTADSINASVAFASKIPVGTEAIVLEPRTEWARVEFGKSKIGWVPRSAIRMLAE